MEPFQNRRSSVRIFQRNRMGKLGKYLGNLEWNYATRRRSHAPRCDDRALDRTLSYISGMGTLLSDAAFWSICQPMAAEWRHRLDDRQPERLRHRRTSNRGALPSRRPLLRPLSWSRTHAGTPRR